MAHRTLSPRAVQTPRTMDAALKQLNDARAKVSISDEDAVIGIGTD
jgi:hypothetical protein